MLKKYIFIANDWKWLSLKRFCWPVFHFPMWFSNIFQHFPAFFDIFQHWISFLSVFFWKENKLLNLLHLVINGVKLCAWKYCCDINYCQQLFFSFFLFYLLYIYLLLFLLFLLLNLILFYFIRFFLNAFCFLSFFCFLSKKNKSKIRKICEQIQNVKQAKLG